MATKQAAQRADAGVGAPDPYNHLSRDELVALLRRREADGKDRLQLVWSGEERIERDAALNDAFVALKIDESLSDGSAPWLNLIIEGDNFDALRWLRMTHRGRVKCIYVDPPYNTGAKDWVYNDRYHELGSYGQSTWLDFLHRRFSLARDLLAEDGVLLVSINDENRALLELMLDQTLPGMRLGSLVWRSRTGAQDAKGAFLSVNHEHILVFAGPKFRFAGSDKDFKRFENPDNHPLGEWTDSDLTVSKDRFERRNSFFPLRDPDTDIFYPPNPDRVWGFVRRESVKKGQRLKTAPIEELIEQGRILFPKDQRVEVWNTMDDLLAAIRAGVVPGSAASPALREDLPDLGDWVGRKVGFGTPRMKKFRMELKTQSQPLSSWITPRAEAGGDPLDGVETIISGTTDEGTKALKSAFGRKVFNYPKPVSLIRELIRQSTGPDDLVLDFFAGSGTTAQAVMELNAADGGARRFILVSHEEATPEAPGRNLCRDVTAERVRRLNRRAAKWDTKSDTVAAAPFAYLTARRIPIEDVTDDLDPAEVWCALQALHRLPLTPYEPEKPVQVQAGAHTALAFCHRVDGAAVEALEGLAKPGRPLAVYAWSPGPVERALPADGVEVHALPEALTRRFRA